MEGVLRLPLQDNVLMRAVGIVLVGLGLVAPGSGAWAEDKPPIVVTGDNHPGVVDTTVTAPGTEASKPDQGSSPSSSSADNGVTCTWTAESEHSQEVWQWLGSDPN